MSDKHSYCEPYEACMVRFLNIAEKLEMIHSDQKKMDQKLSNGLTDKINELEGHIRILQDERAQRSGAATRLHTAFLTLIVALSTAAIFYSIRHYGTHSQPTTIQTKP